MALGLGVSNENILLYATERDLYSVNADKTSYQVNKANTEYGKTIVRPTSDSAYIELDFVTMFSAMTYEYYENPNRLVITSTWGETTFASIKKEAFLRNFYKTEEEFQDAADKYI